MSQIFSTSPSVLKHLTQPSWVEPQASRWRRLHLLPLGLRARSGAVESLQGRQRTLCKHPVAKMGRTGVQSCLDKYQGNRSGTAGSWGVTVTVGHGGKRKRSLGKGPGDWVVEGRQDSPPQRMSAPPWQGAQWKSLGPWGVRESAGLGRHRQGTASRRGR